MEHIRAESSASLAARVSDAAVEIQGLVKTYQRGQETLNVLDGLALTIARGSFEALMGPSGSGKSTLLNIIAGLDRPTAGTVRVAGSEISRMGESKLAHWRSQTIGFIFQAYNLIPVLTAEQNVELPLLLAKLSGRERKQRATLALQIVGLEDRAKHFPKQLSGGQEQRVAIARAIVSDPAIIVADEPTGDLDRHSADAILELLQRLNQELNKTILMVTHDPEAAKRASVIHRLDKGRLLQ